MRIVLMGQGLSGERCLETLIAARKAPVALVVPGNRSGDKVEPIKERARRHHIPTLRPRNANHPDFVRALRDLAPDLIVAASFTQVFSKEIVFLPRLGCINVHGALLPQYRGLHAHNWAIINGEAETGATIHYIDEGVDTGDIIAQGRVAITDEDDAVTLRDAVTRQAAGLLLEAISQIEQGAVARIEQDEAVARYWPRRKPEDGRIDWQRSARQIFNLVRALVPPWPGAFTSFRRGRLLIWEARPAGKAAGEPDGSRPGRICGISDDGFLVAAGTGQLLVKKVQAGEGPTLSGAGFVKQFSVRIGEPLGA